MKQCLRLGIWFQKLLADSVVSCGIFSQMCFPLAANALQISIPNKDSYIIDKSADVSVGAEVSKVGGRELQIGERGLGRVSIPEQILPVPIAHNTQKAYRVPHAPNANSVDVPSSPVPLNSDGLTQQNSVSELSDVKPTDWAYKALRSLMKRYGVTVGYPDSTFHGNRPLSRDEFAAGLAAVLDKVDSMIGSAVGNQYIQEDIITLRRLQREYRSALDQLQRSFNSISDRTTKLKAEQFSLTTKLQGEAIIATTNGSNANSTIVSRQRLTLSTSFHGSDVLVTQLESGNNGLDAIGRAQQKKNLNLLGTTGLIADGGGLDYGEYSSNLQIRRLYYSFRPQSHLAVTVGAKMLPRDFIDRNSYANNEAVDFSSSFFLHNPLIIQNQIDRGGGAGTAIAWNPRGGKLTLRSLYIAADANQSTNTINLVKTNTKGGLFGDRHQASAELEYLPTKQLALRLQYTNALINNTDINAFGVNAEYTLNGNTGIFGRLGYGNYQGFNTAINRDLDLHPFSWAVGLGFRNLLLPGTVAGIAVGQPFVTDGLGNATQTNFETFYNLKLNEHISVTPTLSFVTNPNNDSEQGTIWQGTFRTVFSF